MPPAAHPPRWARRPAIGPRSTPGSICSSGPATTRSRPGGFRPACPGPGSVVHHPLMSERILSAAELSRATLARQLLLERVSLDPISAIERLVALQAQEAASPHIALWTRLEGF